ncbi:MAG TPA: UDP-N-acetylglucosamine diphosphorylase/glucosamine-1-phosphate N-acetyltransferase [Chloroflexi bacterium]|nr:UDP-N-acetylglucosamine diphosphorylase/glucosamine-1-phosphate N-acetyltransferase [Chloroflexota bacterium]
MRITPVVLAAGQGTRMKSDLPKVLHPVLGRPLVWHAIHTLKQVTDVKPVLVVGHGAEEVQKLIGEEARFAYQEQQLGTGHAVMQTADLLKGQTEYVLVSYADMPLLSAETFQQILDTQLQNAGPLTILTNIVDDPRGFGRVIRDANGNVQAIVEELHATPEQRKTRELNTGLYCFRADWLWGALERIPLSPKGEYYLTDLVGIAVSDGLAVQTVTITDPVEVIGINTRVHLAEATARMRERVNRHWMLAGVTIIDPQTTFIEVDVTLGQDTVIWPNTYLQGDTKVGSGCELGPNAVIRDTQIGSHCKVFASVLEHALLEDHVDVGPFGHLRKGAHLAQGVHMGNFGEVKNSYLGPGTKMGHFSYLGDATLGTDVNIGAGTITCNYDGKSKHPTEIGDKAFIGSDTMLVAPIKIGEGARTGAGSVVTKDIPPNTLAVGVPARKIRKMT